MAENMMAPYQAPQLPSLMDILGPGGRSANPGTIFKLLQSPQARMTDVLPSIQELLMGQQAPAIASLREGSRANVAAAQSEAMKRGLTGSDIEAASMGQARAAGEQQVGQLIAQQSSALAQYIMQAMGMDIQGNREMFVTLAQALGQELSSQRDMEQARLDREQAAHLAGKARQSALWGSAIGAGGLIAGGALSDANLKKNIRIIGKAGELDIVKWDWNEKARSLGTYLGESIGVIAQDVERFYPSLVGWREKFKTVNYSGLPYEVRRKIMLLKQEA